MELKWKETRFLNVPLTPEEIRARGEQLADLIKNREELEVMHKTQKEQMKDEMAAFDGRIHHLAQVVNGRVEERSVVVELRYNTTLALIEEVRTDSGEVIKTRQPTEEDRVRSQAQLQPPLLPEDKKPEA